MPQIRLDLTVDSQVIVCFDTANAGWKAPGWLVDQQWTFMQGTSLMVECDARPCWKKDMPAGVGLLMGNRGVGSQVGDTYIAFVQQYVRAYNTPDTLSPAAPIHPAMQRYIGSKLSVANITTDPEGISFDLESCDVTRLSAEHTAIVTAAASLIQAKDCPVTHPWAFTSNTSVYRGRCCRHYVPSTAPVEFMSMRVLTREDDNYLCSSNGTSEVATMLTIDCQAACKQNSACKYFSSHINGQCRLFSACARHKSPGPDWSTFKKTSAASCPASDYVACPHPPCTATSQEVALKLSLSVLLQEELPGQRMLIAHQLAKGLKRAAVGDTILAPERVWVSVTEKILEQNNSATSPTGDTGSNSSNATTGLLDTEPKQYPCSVRLSAVFTSSLKEMKESFGSRGVETPCCPHGHGSIDQHANAISAHAGFL